MEPGGNRLLILGCCHLMLRQRRSKNRIGIKITIMVDETNDSGGVRSDCGPILLSENGGGGSCMVMMKRGD
jgi:hypothetical protein